ncbi:HdeA/HdeB family chaperone [Bosea sp. TAF32]|uniref:HdeA/HdeB family chaperone n=1 Tax=Bosea sp. TAF32 TaxID=3237482 RepID=UPI003F8E1C77
MKKFVLSTVLVLICGAASAQVPLSNYADKDGYVDVQKLTCGQLAGTFQEDADLLAAWYSGWYNGLAKAHRAKITRVKDDLHEVIVYCKANQNITVIKAIDTLFKKKK